MAGSTSKRVLAVRFDREPIAGFIDPATFLGPDSIELLTPAGAVANLPYADVKAVCFVRDLDTAPPWKPNRVFASRPKTEGLWVRFRLRDGDQIDGVMPNNLLQWEAQGFTIAPADPTFQNQRIFLPRSAVVETKVVGVIGGQARRARPKPDQQLEMFDG